MSGSEELRAAKESSLLVPRQLDTLVVTGPDRLGWLNGLVTCDLAKKKVGDAAFGLACAKNGKMEAELWILIGENDVLLGVNAGLGEPLRALFDRHLIMEDASIEQGADPIEWSLLFGPLARAAIASVREAGGRAGIASRSGLDVVPIAIPRSKSLASDARSVVASEGGWSHARVLLGFPEWGIDHGPENYPQEAGLERDGVSFEKGCYLGQESVFMLEKRGHVSKKLVQIETATEIARGDAIAVAGADSIGEIKSVTRDGERSVALGYVKYKYAHAGQALSVRGAPASVARLLTDG